MTQDISAAEYLRLTKYRSFSINFYFFGDHKQTFLKGKYLQRKLFNTLPFFNILLFK